MLWRGNRVVFSFGHHHPDAPGMRVATRGLELKPPGNGITPRAHPAEIEARIDRATVAAIAIVAYALANVAHEGLGHGGACLLVGCTPRVLSSMDFVGDYTGLSRSATDLIEAGGTIANLLAAVVAFAWLARHRAASIPARYFGWLFGTVNLLHATGYLLFSGVGRHRGGIGERSP